VLAADALAGFSGGAGIFRDIPARFATRPSADLDLCGCVSAEAL